MPTQLVRVPLADQNSLKPVLFVKCLFVWDSSYICSVVHKTKSMRQQDLIEGDAANFRRLILSCMLLFYSVF